MVSLPSEWKRLLSVSVLSTERTLPPCKVALYISSLCAGGGGWWVVVTVMAWLEAKKWKEEKERKVHRGTWAKICEFCPLIKFLNQMPDNGLIIPHIYVLFLWFSFILCNIRAGPESFLGCCKLDLHSGTIVLVRAEEWWRGWLERKFYSWVKPCCF